MEGRRYCWRLILVVGVIDRGYERLMDDGGGVESLGVWWSVSNGGGLEGESCMGVLWWLW